MPFTPLLGAISPIYGPTLVRYPEERVSTRLSQKYRQLHCYQVVESIFTMNAIT